MSLYEFYSDYFSINLNDYSNIGIDFEINKILFFVLVALIVSSFVVNYRRSTMHLVIKQLTRHEATSESSAKTLASLGIKEKRIMRALTNSTQLMRMVAHIGMTPNEEVSGTVTEENSHTPTNSSKKKDKCAPAESIDFETERFYISEAGSERAKHILEFGVPSVLNTALFSLLLVAVYICLLFLMPGILNFINSMLEM